MLSQRACVWILGLCFLLSAVAPVGVSAYMTDHSSHEIPCISCPAYPPFAPLTSPNPITDPVFNTTITRRTDPSMSPNDGTNLTSGLIHEYSRYPVLSADNTKVVVQVLGGLWRGYYEIRNLANRTLLARIKAVGDPELSWHPTDPNRLFYRSGNQILIFHVDTGQSETVMSFPQYYAIGTNEEGRPSDDWRYYAFLGYRDSSFSSADIVVVNLSTKQVLATWANAGVPDWVGMSPTGTYVVVMWTDSQGTRLYTRNLSYVRTLVSDHAHSDFAFDAQGNEVLVYHATESGQINELGCPNPPNGSPIASARLLDGQKKILLGDCNDANWNPVIKGAFLGWNWFTPHFSGIASRTHPGWVLVSTYSDPLPECPTHTVGNEPFAREIFWLSTDGSGTVKRLTHHHSDQAVDSYGEKDYFAEPHATSSWDGRIVLYATVWQQPWVHYYLNTVTGSWWSSELTFSGWTALPGGATTPTGPAVVIFNEAPRVFIRGTDNRIYQNLLTASGWSGWSRLPTGATLSSPSATVFNKTLYLFVRGTDNRIYQNLLTTSGWSGWSQVPRGGATLSGPGATVFNNILYLFVRGTDNGIYQNLLTTSGWSGWGRVPGGKATLAGPAATVFQNFLYLTVQGTDNRIYDNLLTSVGWTGWAEVPGGGLTPSGPATTVFNGGLWYVIQGMDEHIYRNTLSTSAASNWTGWVEVPGGGFTLSAPGAAATASSSYLVVRDTDNSISLNQGTVP